jgi:hypothetical protein
MTEANQKGESPRDPGRGSVNQSSDTASHSPRPTPITLAIYRDLRVGVVVTMVMLAAAIVVERILATGWQSALSEYYYTSAHSIFIAALLGLATLAFVYRGSSDTEDALLTLAGVAALIAALVPQVRPKLYTRPGLELPAEYKVESLVQPNVSAVVIALVLGWLLTMWQHRRNRGQQTRSPGGTLALYLLRLIVVVGLIALFFFRDKFNEYAHGVAGTVMLLAFIATVSCAAYVVEREKESPHRHRYRGFYRMIAVVMLVTLIAVVTLHIARPDWLRNDLWWIIVLESALILEFAAYWVVQTIELWNTADRRERLPEDARKRLAEGRTKSGLTGMKFELAKARKDPPGQRLLPLL